jgi:hypothetical protein
MTGSLLRFTSTRIGGITTCCCTICWKGEEARHSRLGLRAIGFGRHGILHAEHFFELTSDVAVEVERGRHDDKPTDDGARRATRNYRVHVSPWNSARSTPDSPERGQMSSRFHVAIDAVHQHRRTEGRDGLAAATRRA